MAQRIIGVRRPSGEGSPIGGYAHLDGVGPFDDNGEIRGDAWETWVADLRINEQGEVLGISRGGEERKLAQAHVGQTMEEALEGALQYWAKRAGLGLIREEPKAKPAKKSAKGEE